MAERVVRYEDSFDAIEVSATPDGTGVQLHTPKGSRVYLTPEQALDCAREISRFAGEVGGDGR